MGTYHIWRYSQENRTFPHVNLLRNTALPQDKFLDLVNLVLTTIWYTSSSQFCQQTDDFVMGGPASSTAETYMQAHEHTAISTAQHPPKVWKRSYGTTPSKSLETIF